jgi:hypothetical protein
MYAKKSLNFFKWTPTEAILSLVGLDHDLPCLMCSFNSFGDMNTMKSTHKGPGEGGLNNGLTELHGSAWQHNIIMVVKC